MTWLSGLWLASYTSVAQAESKPQTKTLLVLGDSLSAAYGLPTETGWVRLMAAQWPELQVVNASIGGETSSGGLNRLPQLLKTHQPDWVILELGANDALRGQSLQSTRQNLQKIIDQSRADGAKVLLLGIRLPTNYGPAYDALLQKTYRQLAEQNGLLFDPFFLEPVADDPTMVQEDGLHPNAKAQPILWQRLEPLVKRLITESTASSR
ncbi:MAG: arylesterase [Hydrogenovibrio sp.]